MSERKYSSWMLERIGIGDSVRLHFGISTVGRHSSSTVRIKDAAHVSRHHAEVEISEDDQTVTIKDLNSSNGIIINRKEYRNKTISLRNADELGFGVSLEELNGADINSPIYVLKYVPIKRSRPPQPPLQQDEILTQTNNIAEKIKEEIEANGSKNNDMEINKPNGEDDKPSCSKNKDITELNKGASKQNGDEYKPCCSKDIKNGSFTTPKPPPQQISDEIFIISDDDSEGEAQSKDKIKPTNEKPDEQHNLQEIYIKKEVINSNYPDVNVPNFKQVESYNKDTTNLNEKDNLKETDGRPVSAEIDFQIIEDNASNKSHEKETIFDISDDDEELPLEKSKEKEIIDKVDNKLKQIEINVKNEHEKSDFTNFKIPNLKVDDNSNEDGGLINPSQNIKNFNWREKENEVIESSNVITVSEEENLDFLNPSQRVLEEEEEEVTNKTNDCEEKSTISANIFKENICHNVNKERIRSVSADIQNIFGDIDNDVVQNSLKKINPLVYNEISGNRNTEKTLKNGDFITLTDDEDDEELKELDTAIPITKETNEVATTNVELTKSPNVFDISLNDSKEVEEEEKQKVGTDKTIIENGQIKKVLQQNNSLVDNIDLDKYCNYVPQSGDEDIEELMFSQVLINDMKDELQDNIDNEQDIPLQEPKLPLTIEKVEQPVVEDAFEIKQEPNLEIQDLENSCWCISDDEDDEELENKVKDWSNKIFSQSFSNNMSQVYDLNESDEEDEEENEDDNYQKEYNGNLLDDIDDMFLDFKNNLNKLHEGLTSKGETIEEIEEMTDEPLENYIELEDKLITKSKEKKSPKLTTNDNSDSSTDSPIRRIRSTKKQKPKMDISSSSSEDEPENETDVLNLKNKEIDKEASKERVDEFNTKVITCNIENPPRPPLQIIDAPSLPKNKGKLRSVSAEQSISSSSSSSSSSIKRPKLEGTSSKLAAIKEKFQKERLHKDLKRKWLEKPSISKKRYKEHTKYIKECRRDKLKELVEKEKNPTKDNNNKRKISPEEHEYKPKSAKVKVTTHNRGAFLLENETKLPPPPATTANKTDNNKPFKIPKIIDKKPESTKKEPPIFKPSLSIINHHQKRSNSLDSMETFSQQISKPDELLLKKQNSDPNRKREQTSNTAAISHSPPRPSPVRRHSNAETFKIPIQKQTEHIFKKPSSLNPICKDAIAARATRTTNKITFASMEKNITETNECQRKLSLLSSSAMVVSKPKSGKKKTVRFNDTPLIHYIERVSGANKKVLSKDLMPLSTYKDRRRLVRQTYPIINFVDEIISEILSWCNEWLVKRNAAAEAASDVIYPMAQQFSSFEHYKSIIFPLMKLEFISLLEREFTTTFNVKNLKVSLEYVTPNKDRFTLVTKLNNKSKEQLDSAKYDLVILQSDRLGLQIFAHMTNSRRGTGSCTTLVYEIMANNFTVDHLKDIKEFNVRPVMDKVRVIFGSLDAVCQLASTPLFNKIINPPELLKCKPSPKKNTKYKGCHELNDRQRQVLLNTYHRIIDETTPNITLLNGPPGTGKSLVITNLALQSLYGQEVRCLDKKILICAQSNAAVDVIAGKLYDISLKMRTEIRFRLIRFGMANKMNAKVLPISLQRLVEHDQLKKRLAKNKDINVHNEENLKIQILQLEAQIADLSSRNIEGTFEEDDLLEKQRRLKSMQSLLTVQMRPEDERILNSWYLNNAHIICATLSSCVTLMQFVNYFDICIIDEATQCTEPWTLLPLKFGINSLVLVGDTQQLPATVLSKKANELGLGTSLFTRIQNCLNNVSLTASMGSGNVTTPNNIICSLQTQYRMNPEICKFPSQYFYRNELINGKITMEYKTPILPFSVLNLAYTQNASSSNGKITNNLEAEFVAKLLKALDGFIPNRYNSYGVITPYAHHCATLEASIKSLGLTNIMVNTIDSYQGLEKDVIIISNARTNGIGFLSNPQRLNVALTRPKKCLILCGNFKNLETVPAWRCLLENARERHVYHEISTDCVSDMQRNVIDKIRIKK